MPLSQFSIDHVGESGTGMTSSASSNGELLPPKPSAMETPSSVLQGPSSIQSMLKNTTETGDVGQFSIRPPRVPQSFPRTSLSLNGVQPSTAKRVFASQHHINDGDTNQSEIPSYAGSTASGSAASLHKTRSQRSHRAPSQALINEAERQRTNTQNTDTDRSLPNPIPHATNRPPGLVDLRGARPRSPFAYPTRLKRPGYRPSSPAFGDLNRSIYGTTMSGYRDGSPRTSSPTVLYGARRTLSSRHYGYSQPEPSLRRYPPSPMTSHNSTRASSPLSARQSTPGPPLSFDQNFLESRSLALNSNHNEWSRPSISPSPVFYDYTEAFEETHFRPPVASLAEQVILENPNMMYRGHHSAKSSSGMPANSENSNQSPRRPTLNANIHSPTTSIHRGLSANACQYRTANNDDFAVKTGAAGPENLSLQSQNQLRRCTTLFTSEEPVVAATAGDHEATLDDAKIPQPAPAISDFTAHDSHVSPNSISRSLSPKESMYSARSSPNLEKSNLSRPIEILTKTDRFEPQPKEPSATSCRSDLAVETADVNRVQPSLGAAFCDRWSESECSQIYAPTPERSMSSPSHRDRFSRIFSIDEGPLEANESDREQDVASTGLPATGKTNEEWILNPNTLEAPYRKLENLPNTLPRAARDTHEMVVKSKSEYGSESTFYFRDSLSKQKATISQKKLLVKPGTEKIDPTQEAQAPSRLNIMRKPALSLSTPSARRITGDQIDLNSLDTDSNVNPMITSLEGNADRQLPAPQLSSMPSVISFRSCSPPVDLRSTELPFSFTPLLASEEVDKEADLQKPNKKENDKDDQKIQSTPPKYKLKVRNSLDSSPNSRPWNFDTSYPWTNPPPELSVAMPEQSEKSPQNVNKLPRFKLKIQRASILSKGPTKLTKPSPMESFTSPKPSMSSDYFQSRFSTQTSRPSVTITQNNSSHSGPVANRFAVNNNRHISSSVAPTINLVPPSPNLNLEVRSFFSDDSS